MPDDLLVGRTLRLTEREYLRLRACAYGRRASMVDVLREGLASIYHQPAGFRIAEPMNVPMKERLALRFTVAETERLKTYADERGISIAAVLREALYVATNEESDGA